MALKTGKPGASSTRHPKKAGSAGDNTKDTIRFVNNSSSAEIPGKPVAREVVKDVGSDNKSKLPRKEKRSKERRKGKKKRQAGPGGSTLGSGARKGEKFLHSDRRKKDRRK